MSDLFTGVLRNEPAEAYHSKREYVSSSPLVKMALSPLHFFTAWTTETESTDPMERGNFIHSLLLEQDIAKYAPRPMKNDRLVATNTKDYEAWFAQLHAGQTPIHPDLYAEAMTILNSACGNKTFLKAFDGSEKEVSYYGTHKETGLPVKARTDMIAKNGSFVLDVKSTSDISRFERQIFSLGYDVRLVHYAETIKAATGHEIPEFYFFAIESKAPYGSKMFRLNPAAVDSARIQWNAWMNEIALCKAENSWPGFTETITDVERPAYLASEPLFFGEVG